MLDMETVDLGATTLDPDTGAVRYDGRGPQFSEDPMDSPSFTDMPVFSALGLAALPAPADENGNAEALICTGIAGVGPNGMVVGARDVRTAKITGAMKPGDTVVHSTGKHQAAQLQLKEAKRQAALLTKTPAGKNVGIVIDGSGSKLSLMMAGATFEISEDNGILLLDSTGTAGFHVKDGVVCVLGKVVLGGRTPSIPMHAGLSAGPGVPVPGVFAGSPLP